MTFHIRALYEELGNEARATLQVTLDVIDQGHIKGYQNRLMFSLKFAPMIRSHRRRQDRQALTQCTSYHLRVHRLNIALSYLQSLTNKLRTASSSGSSCTECMPCHRNRNVLVPPIAGPSVVGKFINKTGRDNGYYKQK
ncbi:hypothetical protein RRG08_034229 [Elysia crispata]|uniref:Uncharacterized protein n=1 Tax=Elysia crispata TaxID=231223 RepID=A0AAE1A115_9GAST|nr:hypothetical protein RRG08_034229 [Elysia crispata]